MMLKIRFVRYFYLAFRWCAVHLIHFQVLLKHWLLGPYYQGLREQAFWLYRTSPMFRVRWEALGYEYAMESFEGESALYFMGKAQRSSLWIRLRILIDATLGRAPTPYYEDDEEV